MKQRSQSPGSPSSPNSPQVIQAPRLDSLKQINLNAAGLDVGDREIYFCVPEGRSESSVRVFPTFTADINSLAEWLRECEVSTVAMESTGVYWIPIFQILESQGFEVYLDLLRFSHLAQNSFLCI